MKKFLVLILAAAVALTARAQSSPTVSIPWRNVSKSGSSLADLATRSASDLNSGTLAAARLPSYLQGVASGSYLDLIGGIGSPASGHAQFGGSGSYGASIIGNGSAYDFGLFNKNGTDVMHVATGGTTVAFSGIVSAAGVSGLIGQATTSSQYFDLGSTTNNTKVGYNLGVYDGSNNYRSSLFLDAATGITGINLSYSSGTPKFQVQYAGVSMMELSSTASTFSGTGTHLFSGSLGLAYAGTQKWHLTGTTGGDLLFTRSGIADRVIITSDGVATFSGQLIGKGTATNDNAATGYIGEYLSSTLASGSAITLTNATAANVTSLSLTAGDWDVSGVITFNGAVTGSYSTAGISTTSATHQAYPNSVDSPYLPTAAANASTIVPAIRISVASTTTVYLVALEAFSAGSAKAYGFISARRAR